MAASPTLSAHAGHMTEFRPTASGFWARAVFALLVAGGVLAIPLMLESSHDDWVALAAVYAVIGLSVNIITGHAGQISLGHQAFVGIGAFMSAFVVTRLLGTDEFAFLIPTANFVMALLVAGVIGGLMAFVLGLVALRIRGLYLALITVIFGLMAENTIFNWRAFTGGGAGANAPRPAAFESNQAFAYLCLGVLAVVLFLDWRLVRSKAGRAIVALRNNEQVAATLGVNVTGYKLLAFATAGLLAGVAGSLFGHLHTRVTAPDFDLNHALIWVLMAVVGGLGSRAGVVIGSSVFALLSLVLPAILGEELSTVNIPFLGDVLIFILIPLIGAFLLLLTLTLFPGGIGQQLLPIRRWLAGGPLVEDRHEAGQMAGFPALVALIAVWIITPGPAWLGLLVGLAVGVAVALFTVALLAGYVRRARRVIALARHQRARLRAAIPDVSAVPEAAAGDGATREREAVLAESSPRGSRAPDGRKRSGRGPRSKRAGTAGTRRRKGS